MAEPAPDWSNPPKVPKDAAKDFAEMAGDGPRRSGVLRILRSQDPAGVPAGLGHSNHGGARQARRRLTRPGDWIPQAVRCEPTVR
jgi:hypothetical protein